MALRTFFGRHLFYFAAITVFLALVFAALTALEYRHTQAQRREQTETLLESSAHALSRVLVLDPAGLTVETRPESVLSPSRLARPAGVTGLYIAMAADGGFLTPPAWLDNAELADDPVLPDFLRRALLEDGPVFGHAASGAPMAALRMNMPDGAIYIAVAEAAPDVQSIFPEAMEQALYDLLVFVIFAVLVVVLGHFMMRGLRLRARMLQERKNELEELYAAQGKKLNDTLSSLGESRTRLEMVFSIFENTLEGLLVFDSSLTIVEANPSVTRITGWESQGLRFQPLAQVVCGQENQCDFLCDTLALGESWEGEAMGKTADGRSFPIWLRVALLPDEFDQQYYLASFHDISVTKSREEQIRHMAMHDALTGLPNRNFLQRHLESTLATQHGREHLAIIYFDLDGFKRVNDKYGHDAGDQLLRMVAERLPQKLRSHDIIVRVGGDEFVIVCQRIRNHEQAAEVAQRLLDGLREPFAVAGADCVIGASIGVAMPPEGGITGEELLKNADMAMYAAKAMGKNCFCFFTDTLQEEARQRISLESRLNAALVDEGFEVHFQPIVSFDGSCVIGVEALARWVHDANDPPSPRAFIRLAEETGLILPLTEVICKKALAGFALLLQEQDDLYLALNVSPIVLRNSQLPAMLDELVTRYGLPRHSIVLEIPESAFENAHGPLQEALLRFTDKGYRIAVDNFGSIYNAFSYLRNVPVAFLKLDGTYVRQINGSEDSASLVQGVRSMGEWIGAVVVAEGVETGEQSESLQSMGYQCGQGYLYCGPAPVEATRDYLKRMRENPVELGRPRTPQADLPGVKTPKGNAAKQGAAKNSAVA